MTYNNNESHTDSQDRDVACLIEQVGNVSR